MSTTTTSETINLTTARLGTVLWANAACSGLSALTLIALAGPLSAWFDVPRAALTAIGLGLASFAVFVAVVARFERRPWAVVMVIVLADFAWVVAAAAVILIPDVMSNAGRISLGLVSVVVLELGLLEWMEYRKVS